MQFIDETTKQKPLPLLGDLGEVACGRNPVLRRLRLRWAGPKPVLVQGAEVPGAEEPNSGGVPIFVCPGNQ
jgi:hypothetical protein